MVMWVFRKIYHLEAQITKIHFNYLGIIMIVLGALYGYFTFSEYLTSWYGSIKWDMEVLFRLFSPKEYYGAFIFAVFIGVLLPIIIVTVPRLRNINSIAFAAMIAVFALWVKRYLIIIPTLETPLLPIHDLRPEYAHYSPTWVEWGLTVAGVALFILLFYLFSKFIPIIPVVKTGEEKDYSRLRKHVFDRQVKQLNRLRKKSESVTIALVFLMTAFFCTGAMAQDDSRPKPLLGLEYLNRNGNRILTGTLRGSSEGRYFPLEGMNLTFSSVAGTEKKLIGTVETGKDGKAMIGIPGEIFSQGKPGGTYTFECTYPGSANYLNSTATINIKNISMELTFATEDEGKKVICKVWETGTDGNPVPVNDLTIQFYVPRTFSLLKVGEGPLTDGAATIAFPVTLPGDSAGGVTVIAKIEDDEIYGNVRPGVKLTGGNPFRRKHPLNADWVIQMPRYGWFIP